VVFESRRLRSAGLVGTQDGAGRPSDIVLRNLVPRVPSRAANLSEHGHPRTDGRSVGQEKADWARICAVKQVFKVQASATGFALCYSFLACLLPTILTDATTSAKGQLCVHHGSDLTLELTRYRCHAVPALPTSFLLHPLSLPPTPRHSFDAVVYAPLRSTISLSFAHCGRPWRCPSCHASRSRRTD
jgi:hypothetical protein